MVIGTSTLAQYEIDGAVGMYSGVFNNPFMIGGAYRRRWFKTTLTISSQFHHTQMDGSTFRQSSVRDGWNRLR